jgi:hypothetical protein
MEKREGRSLASHFQMRTPDQYRDFAAQCYRLAAEAQTEELQQIMREMARAWGEVAEELETRTAQSR